MNPPTDKPISLVDVAGRTTLFGLAWFGLTGTDWHSWIVGGPCVMAAAWLSARLRPAQAAGFSPWGMLCLLLFFFKESLVGGLDVALRVMVPGRQIDAGYRAYPIRLQEGPALHFFMLMLSNMPGTLSASLSGNVLTVHCIQQDDAGFHAALRLAETRVARAFNASLIQG